MVNNGNSWHNLVPLLPLNLRNQFCIECRYRDFTTSRPCAARVRLHPFNNEAYLEATVLASDSRTAETGYTHRGYTPPINNQTANERRRTPHSSSRCFLVCVTNHSCKRNSLLSLKRKLGNYTWDCSYVNGFYVLARGLDMVIRRTSAAQSSICFGGNNFGWMDVYGLHPG
jgi:hypothetical protein